MLTRERRRRARPAAARTSWRRVSWRRARRGTRRVLRTPARRRRQRRRGCAGGCGRSTRRGRGSCAAPLRRRPRPSCLLPPPGTSAYRSSLMASVVTSPRIPSRAPRPAAGSTRHPSPRRRIRCWRTRCSRASSGSLTSSSPALSRHSRLGSSCVPATALRGRAACHGRVPSDRRRPAWTSAWCQ